MSRRPWLIAHRGASAERPENSMAAFARAIEVGADMIETDLHLSADDEIVLVHDADLSALGGPQDVSTASLDVLRRLDLGQGERIPRLAELLDLCAGKIALNLEIKSPRGATATTYAGLEAKTLAAVRQFDILDQVLFSSFHPLVLNRLRELEPSARVGVLMHPNLPMDALLRAEQLAAESIHPERSMVSEPLLRQAQGQGLRVHSYTVDDLAEAQRFSQWGIDGIFTNDPKALAHGLRLAS